MPTRYSSCSAAARSEMSWALRLQGSSRLNRGCFGITVWILGSRRKWPLGGGFRPRSLPMPLAPDHRGAPCRDRRCSNASPSPGARTRPPQHVVVLKIVDEHFPQGRLVIDDEDAKWVDQPPAGGREPVMHLHRYRPHCCSAGATLAAPAWAPGGQ